MKKYAVIGHPIGHTMSPFIHKNLMEMAKIKGEYSVLDIKPEELNTQFNDVLKNLDGYNVTIPHKPNIIPYLDKLDSRAKMYLSVNTVLNENGVSSGFTTDPDGFINALKDYNLKPEGNVLILGCGGVSRTFAFESALCNADITIAIRDCSVDRSACNSLIKEINEKIDHEVNIKSCFLDNIEGNYDLLVNGTPVGMFPNTDAAPVSDNVIKNCTSVFDAVYNPLETTLIKKAKQNGSIAIGGMNMLVYQAAKSQQIWNGCTFDSGDIKALCHDTSKELMRKYG